MIRDIAGDPMNRSRFPVDEWRPPTCRCRECGAQWDTTQWRHLGQRMERGIDEEAARRMLARVFDFEAMT